MPTRRVGDLEERNYYLSPPCQHPEHNAPTMMLFEPGIYEHVCPGCGVSYRFRVDGPPWRIDSRTG